MFCNCINMTVVGPPKLLHVRNCTTHQRLLWSVRTTINADQRKKIHDFFLCSKKPFLLLSPIKETSTKSKDKWDGDRDKLWNCQGGFRHQVKERNPPTVGQNNQVWVQI